MADLAPAIVKDIFMIGSAIKKAVDTVHQNKEECQDLQSLMASLTVILLRLHNMGDMSDPMICNALVGLHRSLNRALKLVTKCQKRNNIIHFFKAKDMANQLRRVRDNIHTNMHLATLANIVSIMEITIELTRTTTLRYGGPHPLHIQPQQDATEMEIYGSHSLTGGARPVEDVKEIITTVTTGTDTSSALSSSVTEFSLSETVTTPHVSENFNGGGGYTVVTKQKFVIKVGMTCDKSRIKAMALVARAAGVQAVSIFGDGRDQVVVVGFGVDSIKLITTLRRKVGHAMLLQVDDVSRRPTVVNATEESQLAVDLAKVSLVEVASAQGVEQEPATRRPHARSSGCIRSFASKLFRFMRPRRPRSSTCQAAPSSSHPLIEHTDAPAPAPHFFPGESSSRRGKDGNLLLLENPDLLLPQHQPTAPSAMQSDQGELPQQQWQLVKKKHCWRKERGQRKPTIVHYRAETSAGTQAFKCRALNRCYNCLALDHRVAQCRDPPRCWKCWRFGHISRRCNITCRVTLRQCSEGSSAMCKSSVTPKNQHVDQEFHHHARERDHKSRKPHGFRRRSSSWIDEMSRDDSQPPYHDTPSSGERRALRLLGQSKGNTTTVQDGSTAVSNLKQGGIVEVFTEEEEVYVSDAIEIVPQEQEQLTNWPIQGAAEEGIYYDRPGSDVIVIHPNANYIVQREGQKQSNKPRRMMQNKDQFVGNSTIHSEDVVTGLTNHYQDGKVVHEEVQEQRNMKNRIMQSKGQFVGTSTIVSEGPVSNSQDARMALENNAAVQTQGEISAAANGGPVEGNIKSPTPTLTPTVMDPATKEQGMELHEVLRLFKQAITTPLSSSILHTPKHKTVICDDKVDLEGELLDKQRKSPRLGGKKSKGKSVIRLGQDLVAKKCGIIPEEETLDDMTLREYLNIYKKPLTKDSIEAITKLTEVAQKQKKKKKIEKKDKKIVQPIEVKEVQKKSKQGKKFKMAPVGVSA